MVTKQAEEWQLQSELREQMQGYKRMRQQHKGQVGSNWECRRHYLECFVTMELRVCKG